MGSAHARQQLQSRGSLGAVPGSGLGQTTGGAPVPEAGSPAAAAADNGQDRIPVVFTWNGGGQNVFLAASFNQWSEKIPMVRPGNDFSVVQELPRGVHQYKFIVDDQWRFAQEQFKTQDAAGNLNNVIDITNYTRFQADQFDQEPPARWGQQIPDPNDYTLDAPAIPMALLRSPFCAMPPRPEVTGNEPLKIQTHALCDHIYVKERPNEISPTTIAVTHRYNQKYSTTVFATRGPGFCPESGQNLLKAAVRRPPRKE